MYMGGRDQHGSDAHAVEHKVNLVGIFGLTFCIIKAAGVCAQNCQTVSETLGKGQYNILILI
jgi:hypothetical protein